jgi:zinc transporter 7
MLGGILSGYRKFIFFAIVFIVINEIMLHGSHSHGHGQKKNKNATAGSSHDYFGHGKQGSHVGHGHTHGEDSEMTHYISNLLTPWLEGYSKSQQAYMGAFIVSSAPIPIFILILLFNIKDIKLLDIMSAFASGALLGDVVLHNLPEILNDGGDHNHSHSHETTHGCSWCFLFKKEALICWGVIVLFVIEKIISLYTNRFEDNPKSTSEVDDKHSHGHSHGHSHSTGSGNTNIIISIIGDFIHNITDGIAIGAAFSTSKFIIYSI